MPPAATLADPTMPVNGAVDHGRVSLRVRLCAAISGRKPALITTCTPPLTLARASASATAASSQVQPEANLVQRPPRGRHQPHQVGGEEVFVINMAKRPP